MNKSVIYLNPAHSPRSPGGVFCGRTEHGDSLELCRALKRELLLKDGTLPVEIVPDSTDFSCMSEDDMLFVFHRGTSYKSSPVSGAEIYVKEAASADIQYDAYRVLSCLCGDKGFRYRRLHTLTGKSPFLRFGAAAPRRAFLLKTGYIDSAGDNGIFDRELKYLAQSLAREIYGMYKERKYEDNS